MLVRTRGPRFLVVTGCVAVLSLAAIGLRIAAKYLPERQPNRLSAEYGSYVRQSERQRIDWYPFGEEAFRRAASEDRLIFVDAGSLYSRRANILTYSYEEEAEVARLLNSYFVPVKVDVKEMPWVADAIALNQQTLERAEGAIVVVLDPGGMVMAIREVDLRQIEGSSLYDFLAGLVHQRLRAQGSIRTLVEAARSERARTLAAFSRPGEPDPATVASFVNQVLVLSDPETIGGALLPVSPAPPRLLLDVAAVEGSDPPLSAAFGWLLKMRLSPAYDHAEGGFFSTVLGPGWTAPGYGKEAGLSAQLAALYAVAGQATDAPLCAETARQTAAWITRHLVDPDTGLFYSGLATDEFLLEGSAFYDWTRRQLPDEAESVFRLEGRLPSIEPNQLQLPPPSRGRAGVGALDSPERTASQAYTEDILRIAAAMAELRSEREQPKTDATTYATVNGQVIAGLFTIGRLLRDEESFAAARAGYQAAVGTFVQPLGDVLHTPTGTGRTTGYLGGYAWMARAAIENYAATADDRALDDAIRITRRMIELFEHPDGGFRASLVSLLRFAPFALEVRPITDMRGESLNSVAMRNLYDLAALTGYAGFRQAADRASRAFFGSLQQMSLLGAGYVGSIVSSRRPAILIKGADAGEVAISLSRRHPLLLVARNAGGVPEDGADGIYVYREGQVFGPYEEAALAAVLR